MEYTAEDIMRMASTLNEEQYAAFVKYVEFIKRLQDEEKAEGRHHDKDVISRFYGMVIRMTFSNPENYPPHFHVSYGEHFGIINIQTLKMIEGDLPYRALSFAQEWGAEHKPELMFMWSKKYTMSVYPLE